MPISTKTAGGDQDGFIATLEIDSRMMVTADILDDWARDRGMRGCHELLSVPGFPAPTDSTANFPMAQREWAWVDVWVFMLRADCFTVHFDEGVSPDASPPCMIKFVVTKAG